MVWARRLAYITGTVDQELLLRNEYLAAENRIFKAQIKGRLLLSDGEKATLAEIAYRLGRKAAGSGDGGAARNHSGVVSQAHGQPVRRLQVSTLSRGPTRGCGHRESGRVHGEGEPELGLRPHRGSLGESGSPNVRPNRGQHSAAPWHCSRTPAEEHRRLERFHWHPPGGYGGDGLLHGGSPDLEGPGHLLRAVLHPLGEPQDLCIGNDAASGPGVDGTAGPGGQLAGVGISGQTQVSVAGSRCEIRPLVPAVDRNRWARKTIVLPARSPNLNAYAECWVRSVKEECLSRFILFGERSLRRALQQYGAHYHEERNHQGRQNLLLFPRPSAGAGKAEGTIRCRERLGGLLKYYDRQAA